MDTNHFTTFGTDPFHFLIPNEMSNPKFIYHFEIVDHAHSILCSISFIQLFQPGAWITITTIGTILNFALGDLFAIFNSTSITVFRFLTISISVLSATWTRILFSNVSQAKATVHSARCNQICGNCCLHSSSGAIPIISNSSLT
jgi:hypothetical protein